jgi:hypothetical protein
MNWHPVRHEADGKAFISGMAELKAVNKRSQNYQLLDDYAVFFFNSR